MSHRSLIPSRSLKVDRRAFLRSAVVAAGAAGVGPAVLRGRAEAQETPSPIRPDAAAKRGGTLRYGVHTAPAHFDVHQSGTVANIGAQSPMYDTLIRRHPKDGQTIIPDLAWKWDISPDGKRYTFYLRKGVKFHDGGDLTSEDVKATYDRIAHPPKGIVIPRTPLFSAVSEIVALDSHRIEFRLNEPRPRAFMLGAFASGWNIIVRKKTLDETQSNLRQVMAYPGTGPFKHVSRKDKEVWIMEKNPGYWNKGLPYVDKLEVYHMPPFSAELGAAFLSGKLDYARLLDPVSWRKAKEMPGVTAAAFNQSVVQACSATQEEAARRSPRAPGHPPRHGPQRPRRGRQGHRADADRRLRVSVPRDVDAARRAREEARLPEGHHARPWPEAKKLMQEAGYGSGIKGLDFLVRESNTFKLWAVAIQAMLKEHLNIETNLRVVQISQWFDEAAAGNFDLASAPSSPRSWIRPTIFTRLVRQGRPAELPAAGRTSSSTPRQADRARARRHQAQGDGPPGRGHPRAGPAAHPGVVRADLRRLVQQGARPEPVDVLRHLRRGPLGPGLAGASGQPGAPDARHVRKYLARRAVFAARHPVGVSLHASSWSCGSCPATRWSPSSGVEGHAEHDAGRPRAHHGRPRALPTRCRCSTCRWLRDIASGQLGKSFFRGDTVAEHDPATAARSPRRSRCWRWSSRGWSGCRWAS